MGRSFPSLSLFPPCIFTAKDGISLKAENFQILICLTKPKSVTIPIKDLTLEKLDLFRSVEVSFPEYFQSICRIYPDNGIGQNYGNWILQPFSMITFPKYGRTMVEVQFFQCRRIHV